MCCHRATGPLVAPVAIDTSNYRFGRPIGFKTLLLWRTVLFISSNLNYQYLGVDASPFVFYCRSHFTVFFKVVYRIFIGNVQFHCKVSHISVGPGAAMILLLNIAIYLSKLSILASCSPVLQLPQQVYPLCEQFSDYIMLTYFV